MGRKKQVLNSTLSGDTSRRVGSEFCWAITRFFRLPPGAVLRILEENGIVGYVPRLKRSFRIPGSRKRRIISEAAFPGYMFIKTDLSRGQMMENDRVWRVCRPLVDAYLSNDEVEKIRKDEKAWNRKAFNDDEHGISVGEKLKISSGPCEGMVMEVTYTSKNAIKGEVVGSNFPISISPFLLERLTL